MARRTGWGVGPGRVLVAGLLALGAAGAVAAGNSGAPVLLYSDILSGPTSGGENNKGIYLSVFGRNFGSRDALGKTTHLFIGDAEADNYRVLTASRGRPDIQQITVQIGALNHARAGAVLPLKLVVNGMASNSDLTFTVHPGVIYFVNPATGIDTPDYTGGTFASPFKSVQKPGITLAFNIQPAASAGAYGRVSAGDFVVLRGGTYSGVGFGGTRGEGYFMQALNKSGCAVGVNCARGGGKTSGPITFMGYPGEDAFIDRTNDIGDNKFGGGFSSADTARQEAGAGAWFTLTNLRIESGFNDGPVNTQRGDRNPDGGHWRVVNNELTAASCRISTKCRGAGVSGSGAGHAWLGNHVHDVYDKPDGATDFENHGFYVDGDGSFDIAWNFIEKIPGGNGVQAYSGSSRINNLNVHHNLIRDVGKHGINISNGSTADIALWDNIVCGTAIAGLRIGGTDSLRGLKVYNNTFCNTDTLGVGNPRAALMVDSELAPGAVDIRNNIVVPGGRGRSYVGGAVGFGALAASMSHNLWYDGRGSVPGSGNVEENPRFVAPDNFRLQPGSPAIDAGTAAVSRIVTTDFDAVLPRPQGKGYDIGAFESR